MLQRLLCCGVLALGCPPPTPPPCEEPPANRVPVGLLGEPVEVELFDPDCDNSTPATDLAVVGPDAMPVDFTVVSSGIGATGFRSIAFRFTPLERGLYRASVSFPPGGATRNVTVMVGVRHEVPELTETFVDSMTSCFGGPQRTRSGAVLCWRDDKKAWHYRNGQLVDSFPANERTLVVAGDSVWSAASDSFELRRDVDGGLQRVVASATGLAINMSGERWLGETTEWSAARSADGGVAIFRFDGGELDVRRYEGFRPPPLERQLPLVEDDGLWGAMIDDFPPAPRGGICQLERGCQQTLCPPIVTCPAIPGVGGEAPVVVGVGVRALFAFVGWTLVAIPRPLVATGHIAIPSEWAPELPIAGGGNCMRQGSSPPGGWPTVPCLKNSDPTAVVLPSLTPRNSLSFDWYRSKGTFLGVSSDWVAFSIAPRTVEFFRVPPP